MTLLYWALLHETVMKIPIYTTGYRYFFVIWDHAFPLAALTIDWLFHSNVVTYRG